MNDCVITFNEMHLASLNVPSLTIKEVEILIKLGTEAKFELNERLTGEKNE